jgi:hypothetical protein
MIFVSIFSIREDMEAQFAELMDTIDDVKEKLSDDEYLTLCNQLQEARDLCKYDSLYIVKYVDMIITTDIQTTSKIEQCVKKEVVRPCDFFTHYKGMSGRSMLDEIVMKVRSDINMSGHAKVTRRQDPYMSRNSGDPEALVNLYVEEGDMYEDAIHARLNRSFDVIVLSFDPYGEVHTSDPPLHSIIGNKLFAEIAKNIANGGWVVSSDDGRSVKEKNNNRIRAFCDESNHWHSVEYRESM